MVQDIKAGMSSNNTKITPDEFSGNTLGGKFGNTLIRFMSKIINGSTEWLEERLANFAVSVLIKVEKSGSVVLGSLIKEIKEKGVIPDFLKPIFDEIENPKNEIGALLMNSAGGSAIGGIFGAIFDPLFAPIKYQLNKAIRPYLPDINQAIVANLQGNYLTSELEDLVNSQGYNTTMIDFFKDLYKNHIPFAELTDLLLRGSITDNEYKIRIKKLGFDDRDLEYLENLIYKIPDISASILAFYRNEISQVKLEEIASKNGIDTEFLNILVMANRKLLDLSDIRSIYYRENKDDNWLTEQLQGFGYTSNDLEDIKQILPYFPQVPDLIRFAVREVYSPDIINKYGMYEDLPAKFLEEAKKAGLPEEQAKNYWAAHWDLPAFNMGAEMLHRGKITYDDLKTLLRTLDVMPFWRDKLIEIAYAPYTRVDVRRMFNAGVIDENVVFQSYKDIGYDDEHAANLTAWTILDVQSAEKDLTKADILDAYHRKAFSRSEAQQYLIYLGYDTDEADLYLDKEDYKVEKELKEDMVKIVEDLYKKGLYDDNKVIAELSKYDLQSTEINQYLLKWSVAQLSKPLRPAKADLKVWLQKKIIDKNIFAQEMANLGYNDTYIDYYLREITGKGL